MGLPLPSERVPLPRGTVVMPEAQHWDSTHTRGISGKGTVQAPHRAAMPGRGGTTGNGHDFEPGGQGSTGKTGTASIGHSKLPLPTRVWTSSLSVSSHSAGC